ncbi:hypothetical protein [Pseudanabaena sp. FACHB-2040]|uniref:hypothetical protein n=1 Tax=Pseudanabaena sp. FACHB-2040 TaxID=2692859 RepID=UPI001682D41B|nr:hypothetical protein [Pseudanabaena sp. FACHB-2040]MBD2256388.1 hypothetical protein [Pseudanabaena sp. FACHB-2040]
MALPLLLLLLIVISSKLLSDLIDWSPDLISSVLLPPKWLLWFGLIAVLTWLSGDE